MVKIRIDSKGKGAYGVGTVRPPLIETTRGQRGLEMTVGDGDLENEERELDRLVRCSTYGATSSL